MTLLDSNLLFRARWQYLLNLPIDGSFVEGITIRRRGSWQQLLHNGKILAKTNHVIGASMLIREYEMLTGVHLTYARMKQLDKGLITPGHAYTKENRQWFVDPYENFTFKAILLVYDALDSKGINYVLADD